ncbi:50S ribosomal protein L19 [Patescibacteria group bacterium]|nr:50S ribosomal protein L19 [Patescibacteria group bacterium]
MAIATEVKNQTIRVGDTIRVYQKIHEEGKTRTQAFEGVVIAIKGREMGKSFTVRKIASGGIGVERIWPVASPGIERVSVVKQGNPRRSKLYYLRKRIGKQATKIKSPVKEMVQGEKKKSGKKG